MNAEELCKKMQEEKRLTVKIIMRKKCLPRSMLTSIWANPAILSENTYRLYELNNRNIEEIINQVKVNLGLNSIKLPIIINERK